MPQVRIFGTLPQAFEATHSVLKVKCDHLKSRRSTALELIHNLLLLTSDNLYANDNLASNSIASMPF